MQLLVLHPILNNPRVSRLRRDTSEKAVHVLQLGASVDEMVNMAAVAVVDAQQKQQNKPLK